MDAVVCLDPKVAGGAATAALASIAGAAAAWLCTGVVVHTLMGGAIALYASAITLIVQAILTNQNQALQHFTFYAVAISSTVALCLAATTLGFPLTAVSAAALTGANIVAMMVGLNLFDANR